MTKTVIEGELPTTEEIIANPGGGTTRVVNKFGFRAVYGKDDPAPEQGTHASRLGDRADRTR